ncbi:hypothetical protein GW17_00057008 [Ensete ventricosum]|nr:hypothetical protein GW17_00057008 [Ensete ventricosum]
MSQECQQPTNPREHPREETHAVHLVISLGELASFPPSLDGNVPFETPSKYLRLFNDSRLSLLRGGRNPRVFGDSINMREGSWLMGYNFGHPSYSPPSLCARVTRSDRRSFAVEIYRMDTAREEDA